MRDGPFGKTARFYGRIFLLMFAVAGFICLAAMQAGLLVVAKHDEAGVQDEKPITAHGPTTVRSQPIPIDPNLKYDISAEFRAVDAQPNSKTFTRIYLGVETFDENMEPLRSGPGTHRYGGAVNVRLGAFSHWVKLEGTMTGEGDERYDQFRPGTRFVRVIALLNYESEGRAVEMRNVRFTPQLSLDSP